MQNNSFVQALRGFATVGITCPCCNKRIKKFKYHYKVPFCDSCNTQLLPNPPQYSRASFTTLLVFYGVSAYFFIAYVKSLYVQAFVRWPVYALVAIIFAMVIWLCVKTVFFASGNYTKGVDKFNDVVEDDIDYSHFFYSFLEAQTCPDCSSYRLANYASFTNAFSYEKRKANKKKNKQSGNKISLAVKKPEILEIANKDHFIGCISCHSQYENKGLLRSNQVSRGAFIAVTIMFGLELMHSEQIANMFAGFSHTQHYVLLGVFVAIFLASLQFIQAFDVKKKLILNKLS